MAKNRNRFSSNNIMADYRQQVKDKALKKKNPEKYKRRKQIQKFSSDGTIDKKEGQKLARKGVSLQKIQNRDISDFYSAQSDFNNRSHISKQRNPAATGPSYQPLKIKSGALEAEPRAKKKKKKKERSSAPEAPTTTDYAAEAESTLAGIDQNLENILNPAADAIDPITFQYAASSLVEPGNNLTIGAATDPSKTTGTDTFKRRGKRKKKNRLLKQIGKGGGQLGGFSAAPAAAAGASSAFGNV